MAKTTFTLDEVQVACKRTFELTRDLFDGEEEWQTIRGEIEEEADGDMSDEELDQATNEEWIGGFESIWQTLVAEDLIG